MNTGVNMVSLSCSLNGKSVNRNIALALYIMKENHFNNTHEAMNWLQS